MALDVAALDRVADHFLNIALRPDGWTPALQALSDAAGASGVVVVCRERVGWHKAPYPHTPNHAELMQRYLREDLMRIDDRFRGAGALVQRGIMTDDDCLTDDLRKRSPYYQDFVIPGGLQGFVGVRLDIAGQLSCASIHRESGAPFSIAEQSHLLRVAPRISMALTMASQIEGARFDGFADALETMTTPAFLIGHDGRMLRANAAGARLFGNGLVLTGGRLAAPGPDGERLQRLVAQIFRDGEPASGWSGRPVAIRRARGRPLLVRAQRLGTATALHYFSRAAAIVTATDPDRRALPAAETLQAMFALTAKEAAVLAALARNDGDTVTTATELRIAYETLRSHLKNIHGKTGTRGISALVALVVRLAANGG